MFNLFAKRVKKGRQVEERKEKGKQEKINKKWKKIFNNRIKKYTN